MNLNPRILLSMCLWPCWASICAGGEFAAIEDRVVDPAALTLPSNVNYGQWINGRAYQQDWLLTHGNYQYTAYYNADRQVCVGRRSLPNGVWQVAVLADYTMTSVDSHNVVSLGIAPGDGTLHLAFDHHVSSLHYRRTVPGALDAAVWDVTLFEPVRNWLLSENNPISGVTYPRFETSPDGDLVFTYRNGYPENGNRPIHRYSAATGKWSGRTHIISKDGPFADEYGSSETRSGYMNPMRYTTDGRLHATWVWREVANSNPGSQDNHDLMYAYSDDDGVTWYTGNGTFVDGAVGAAIDSPGVTAVAIPRGLGLINSNAQAVDDEGIVHVVLRHCTDASLAAAGYARGEVAFGPVAARRLLHYWRDLDNAWHANELPATPGSRSAALVADHEGNLLFTHQVSRKLQIFKATKLNQWQDWTLVESYFIDSNLDILVDPVRWRDNRVLSIPYQYVPSAWGEPSAFRVVDFIKDQPASSALYTSYTVGVGEDAFVRNNGTQDGTGTTLMVKNVTTDTFDRKIFLKFDSPRTRDPVFSATLRMKVNLVSGSIAVSVYAVGDDAWSEDTVTWANAPAFGPLLATQTIAPGASVVEWDVTSALANSADSVFSFALWVDAPVNVDLTFRSREFGAGDEGPVLLVHSGSPYSDWAVGHLADETLLAPLADANADGIPNLIAFGMGLPSPVAPAAASPVELVHTGSSWTAVARRAHAATAYAPRLERSTDLAPGAWTESSGQQVDPDYFGPGIDRIQAPLEGAATFFRYAVGP